MAETTTTRGFRVPASPASSQSANTTDNTAAIQAAIDSLPPGGVAFLPAGGYRVSATIKFHERMSLGVDNQHPPPMLRAQNLFTGGISAGKKKANNLRGCVTISGNTKLAPVKFERTEPDAEYFAVATAVSATGSPPAGSRNIFINAKRATGFDICVPEAPGQGNSVRIDWILVR